MVEPDATRPVIEFPCPDYPIKILGVNAPEFNQFVLDTLERIAPDFDRSAIKIRESGKATFIAITVSITATGEQQLRELNQALRSSDLVKMVL